MARYVIRRLISIIPTILGVTIVVFMFLRLIPGDPAVAMLGEHATEENVARVREQFGLNGPVFLDREALKQGDFKGFFNTQYLIYLGRLLKGDLGNSIHRRIPVAETLAQRFPATMELAFFSMFIAIIIGVPVGIISAARRNSVLDGRTMVGSLIGVSMPIFWLGIMLIMLFAVTLQWLPASGRLDSNIEIKTITNFYLIDSLITLNFPAFVNALKHIILPTIALATIPMAVTARMTRSSMLKGPGAGFTIEQSVSDEAQGMTIAFDGLAFLSGSLGADSFFPPGKVADFWGFQYLRDNDPTEMGHNTDFLTRASLNMLTVLTASQRAELTALATSQVASINQYAYDRFLLMKAFRRLLEGGIPAGRSGLNVDAVKATSAKLYRLDGQISYERRRSWVAFSGGSTPRSGPTSTPWWGAGCSSGRTWRSRPISRVSSDQRA